MEFKRQVLSLRRLLTVSDSFLKSFNGIRTFEMTASELARREVGIFATYQDFVQDLVKMIPFLQNG